MNYTQSSINDSFNIKIKDPEGKILQEFHDKSIRMSNDVVNKSFTNQYINEPKITDVQQYSQTHTMTTTNYMNPTFFSRNNQVNVSQMGTYPLNPLYIDSAQRINSPFNNKSTTLCMSNEKTDKVFDFQKNTGRSPDSNKQPQQLQYINFSVSSVNNHQKKEIPPDNMHGFISAMKQKKDQTEDKKKQLSLQNKTFQGRSQFQNLLNNNE